MAFWRLFYHLVWSTHERAPCITAEIENRLFPYLMSKGAELGMYVYVVNGWYDHVHMGVAIPPKLAVADAVGKLKGASAHFLNHIVGVNPPLVWQRGYGALSVGERQRSIAEAYVIHQKENHRNQTLVGWLEREDEQDQAPPDPAGVLQEQREQYELNEPPF